MYMLCIYQWEKCHDFTKRNVVGFVCMPIQLAVENKWMWQIWMTMQQKFHQTTNIIVKAIQTYM